jgi:predicted dehydrogenase
MPELRAGIIGVGMMGRNHVRVFRDLDGVDLVGVADGDGDRYGVVDDLPVHAGVEELIAAGIDLCVVAVPTQDHVAIAIQLADAGVHTLIEKPLAADAAAAEQLANLFESRDLVGAVGHIERYNPALQSLRARLDADELGRPFQVATRRQGPFPNRVRDVGVVKDLATHDVDLAAWVSDAAYTSVSAHTAHRSGRAYEDLVAATGMLTDGTVANHLVNWLTPFKERVTIVTGERGCFVADTLTADLTFYANGVVPNEWEAISTFRGVSEGDMVRYAIPKPEPLAVELAAFRDAIIHGHEDIVTMREGVRAVAVAEALLQSAAKATTVDL